MNFSKNLKKFKLKSPVIFTFHINWKVYENLQLNHWEPVKKLFEENGVENFEFLPILTDRQTHMENRVNQFKKGLERIVDKYEQKAHVVGYSFAGVLPRAYISLNSGEYFIDTILTVGTPNTGSRFADLLIQKDPNDIMFQMEPGIRSAGLHVDWLREEYSSKTMFDFNNTWPASPDVKYFSVGGRRIKVKTAESIRFCHEFIRNNFEEEIGLDGLVCVKEAEYGKHLVNFDADHFELVGMKQNFDASKLFELYSNTLKFNDEQFMSEIKSLGIQVEQQEHLRKEELI